MFGTIPAGATIDRVYYTVPEGASVGAPMTWNEAVDAARAKRARLVAQLTESLAGFSTPEQIAQTADVQTVVELRWVVSYPTAPGHAGITGMDMSVERFGNVAHLRKIPESQCAARPTGTAAPAAQPDDSALIALEAIDRLAVAAAEAVRWGQADRARALLNEITTLTFATAEAAAVQVDGRSGSIVKAAREYYLDALDRVAEAGH